jgi:rubrerythrin
VSDLRRDEGAILQLRVGRSWGCLWLNSRRSEQRVPGPSIGVQTGFSGRRRTAASSEGYRYKQETKEANEGAMGITFNADEILEMALEIERKGAAFYARAAELENAASARAMFLELAAMEEDHQKTFSEMRAALSEDERKEMTYDPYGELPDYLRTFADARSKKQGGVTEVPLKGDESVEDILRLAIGMEKESVVFYLGLQDLVPDRVGGGRVDEILKEEMKHIADLGDLLRCSRS